MGRQSGDFIIFSGEDRMKTQSRSILREFFASVLVTIGVLLFMAAPADAAATYTYTGNAYDNATGGYTTSMSVGGTVTVNSILAPNQTNVNVLFDIAGLNMTGGINTFTLASPFASVPEARVTTDGTGNIVDWSLYMNLTNGDVLQSCSDFGGTINTLACGAGFAQDYAADAASGGFGFNIFFPGAWALTPVPEPATMFLLGSGLAGLAGFRRRRKRH
jgi:hypothetical protein